MSLFDSLEMKVAMPEVPLKRSRQGLFEKLPKWSPPSPYPPDRALVLVHQGHSLVMEQSGAGMEYWMDGVGSEGFTDGMDIPKDGLWVFEGSIQGSTDYWGEHDCWLEGDFREFTEEEGEVWEADRSLQGLWDEEFERLDSLWPCAHCGEPFREHTPPKHEATTRVAVVHPSMYPSYSRFTHLNEWEPRFAHPRAGPPECPVPPAPEKVEVWGFGFRSLRVVRVKKEKTWLAPTTIPAAAASATSTWVRQKASSTR